MVPVQIYSDNITPRLDYACKILFECILQVPYHIQKISEDFSQPEGPSILYSSKISLKGNMLRIIPSGILAENNLRNEKPGVKWMDNIPLLFFGKRQEEEDFDPFSAAFYMASRYEEYLPFSPDRHNRFPASESLSYHNNFIDLPVVHYWANWLGKKVQQFYPGFGWPKRTPEAIFSYDIDVAYAYRGRTVITHLLSFGRDLFTGRFSTAAHKLSTRFGKKSDPSDTYNILVNNPLPTLFFFLLAQKRSRFDRNILPGTPVLRELIRRIASGNTRAGIHPSYLSCEQKNLISSEKKMLEDIVDQPITISRQHYLRFRLPGTFRELAKAGIQHDYSMQYPEMPGFRAGLCVPFPFFDLLENRETGLMLHPGCIMETTFRDYLHVPAANSMYGYLNMWQKVREAGGVFISIWHNDSLWNGLPDDHPLAFRQVHNRLIEIISNDLARKS